jgi:hypothetical protein
MSKVSFAKFWWFWTQKHFFCLIFLIKMDSEYRKEKILGFQVHIPRYLSYLFFFNNRSGVNDELFGTYVSWW